MIRAVVGLNWGDEGKGRMVDYFARKADVVVRFQGGDNAGHTVVNDRGKFAFHNFPSGICHDDVVNIIAPGSVINPDSFFSERKTLVEAGLSCEGIVISDRATVILPYHLQVEALEEIRLGANRYGSTGRGIAPSYADRYAKKAIQIGELLDHEYLKTRTSALVEYHNMILQGCYEAEPLDPAAELERLDSWGRELKPLVRDIAPIIDQAIDGDKTILLEAQLGALRDIIHGIYPFTTSSSVLAGFAAASVPVPANRIKAVTGVTKAYSTCVGAGPFITEIDGDLATTIRERGKEYGATTGRPRRIGYFDAVATRYGTRLQGANEMVITCLDVLSGVGPLEICVGYEDDNTVSERFPIMPTLRHTKPVYEQHPGWDEDITEARRFDDLPTKAKEYVRRVEELVGVSVSHVSVGPDREALIEMSA